MARQTAAEKAKAEAEGAAAAAAGAQPAPPDEAPDPREEQAEIAQAVIGTVSAEERALVAEERLAAAMEAIAAQSAQVSALLEAQAERDARAGGANGPSWDGLSQAEALRRMQGTVSDMLEGDTLLKDVGEQPVTFISKGVNFKAVRIGRQRSTTPNGELQVSRGVTYDFAPTGTYTAKTVEAVAHLRTLASYNVEFWEVGKEPHAAPDSKLVMDKIIEALGDFDDAALEEIEKIEQASHKRENVLHAVAKARKVVQGLVAEPA